MSLVGPLVNPNKLEDRFDRIAQIRTVIKCGHSIRSPTLTCVFQELGFRP